MYPVRRHHGIFSDRLPSLENRLCFSFEKNCANSGIMFMIQSMKGVDVDQKSTVLLFWIGKAVIKKDVEIARLIRIMHICLTVLSCMQNKVM